MMGERDYRFALDDYQQARRQAALQEVLARVTGNPQKDKLLSYEEVRQQLRAIERSAEKLKEIPLDAIVGSVGRYTDFNRKFLPRKSTSPSRWARVMSFARGLTGLPPIDVYQIGEAYFVKDGNHRVSVARRMGNQNIQAYVTQVKTKVPITPDLDPDQLIIKAEHVNFLEKTRLDQLRPEADLSATTAGAYPTILEHIEVHRYFMGLDEEREIPYPEAVAHWFDEIYLPVIHIIRRRGLLRDFPGRTEADLYLWVAKHRQELEEEIGWDIGSEAALTDLAERQRPSIWKALQNLLNSLLQTLIPDFLHTGPPPGTWRTRQEKETETQQLFAEILIALDDSPNAWNSLEQALMLGKKENSRLHGVHVHTNLTDSTRGEHLAVEEEFNRRCQEAGITKYDFQVAAGEVGKTLCQRARFTDLVLLPLNHPPGDSRLERVESGLRFLIRSCPQPLMTIPGKASEMNKAILAYDGSPKAREALFIAAYLAGQLNTHLTVLTSTVGLKKGKKIHKEARTYLHSRQVRANYVLSDLPLPEALDHQIREREANLILIGGYGSRPVLEVVLGSVVDQVLREIKVPAIICR